VSQEKLKMSGQGGNRPDDHDMKPSSMSPKAGVAYKNPFQLPDEQPNGQAHHVVPLSKDFLSPPSPSLSSHAGALNRVHSNRISSPFDAANKHPQAIRPGAASLAALKSKVRRDGCLRVSGEDEDQSQQRAAAMAAPTDRGSASAFLSLNIEECEGA